MKKSEKDYELEKVIAETIVTTKELIEAAVQLNNKLMSIWDEIQSHKDVLDLKELGR